LLLVFFSFPDYFPYNLKLAERVHYFPTIFLTV